MAKEPSYGPLEPSSSQIRLLYLLPLPKRKQALQEPWYDCTDIECTFKTVDLASAPAYEALSYTWGDGTATARILLNGEKFAIRPHLAYALAALRTSAPRILWIDALCINQTNVHERNHQVGLMGNIYRQAERVLVWLGRPGSKWDSLVTGALSMAERLGGCSPETKLPPPPPDLNVHDQTNFDQWLESWQPVINEDEDAQTDDDEDKQSDVGSGAESSVGSDTESEMGESSKPHETELEIRLRIQLDNWSDMKTMHLKHEQQRQRLPGMLGDFQKVQSFLTERQQELKAIQTLEYEQREGLTQLRDLESQQRRKLEKPLKRVMRPVREKHMKAFQKINEIGHNKRLWNWEFQTIEPRARYAEGGSETDDEDQRESQSLYREMLGNVGTLQQSIAGLREDLDQQRTEMNYQMWKECMDLLQAFQGVDESQRRELGKLRDQIDRWQLPENQQQEAALVLLELQTTSIQHQEKQWNQLLQTEVGNMADLSSFLIEQYQSIQDAVDQQRQELRTFLHVQESNLRESGYIVDPFLTQEEAEILSEVRMSRRAVMERRISLRDIELRRWGVESILKQFEMWRSRVYEMERLLPSSDIIRDVSLRAQAEWVQLWLDMKRNEAMEWENLLFGEESNDNRLPTIDLQSLAAICNLPYWSRLWIVQEVLLAKELVFCFGDNSRTTASWDVLAKAQQSMDRIPDIWELSPAINESIDKIRKALPFQLEKLRDSQSGGTQRHWPLHTLVDMTRDSLCQDPRDKIYGVLGLTSGFRAEELEISYEKSVEAVYEDALQWYYSNYKEKEDSPSLIRFSQLLQLSLKGHCSAPSPGESSPMFSLKEDILSQSTEAFCTMGMLSGSILPIDDLLENQSLIELRQRDWISVVVEYLDKSGVPRSRNAIEEELVYLDSIQTCLLLRPSISTYATGNGIVDHLSDEDNSSLSDGICEVGAHQVSMYFIASGGRFGISSSSIREGDLLCEFRDSHMGVILRPRGNHYQLVSKAILSSILADGNLRNKDLGRRLDYSLGRVIDHIGSHSKPTETNSSTVDVTLDVASLQSLTMPLGLSTKHQNREPLDIQEAAFGWYEFTKYGLDMSPGPVRLGWRRKEIIQAPKSALSYDRDTKPLSSSKFTTSVSGDQIWAADHMWKRIELELMIDLEASQTYPALRTAPPKRREATYTANFIADSMSHIPRAGSLDSVETIDVALETAGPEFSTHAAATNSVLKTSEDVDPPKGRRYTKEALVRNLNGLWKWKNRFI